MNSTRASPPPRRLGPAAGKLVQAGRSEALPAACVAPMLATLGTMRADLEAFAFEVKWDGYRALAYSAGATFRLCSRNGIDLAIRFPEVAAGRRRLQRPMLVDGELVALDRQGHPSFSALQTRMPRGGAPSPSRPWDPERFTLQYMVFDILHLDGHALRALPYHERRVILEDLALAGPVWQVPPWHPDGPALLDLMRRAQQEGIIAKRRNSTYHPGRRSPDWIKVKLNQSEEFVIVGFWSSGKHGLSSLLLGHYPTARAAKAGRGLRFCGKVGTGFTEADRIGLHRALAKLASEEPLAAGNLPTGAGITWCKPALVAQIHYSEWTHDGALRHPVFMGLRSDKSAAEVVHRPPSA